MKPLTPSQQMLVDDGLPPEFLRDPDDRPPAGMWVTEYRINFSPLSEPAMPKGAADQIAALRIRRAEEAEAALKQAAKADTKVASQRTKLAAAAPVAKARKAPPAETSKSAPLKGPQKPADKVSAKAAPEQPAKPGSKLEAIVGLLKRPGGCTIKEVLEITHWPSVSMPQQAKSAGLTLRKEKVDGVMRYFAK